MGCPKRWIVAGAALALAVGALAACGDDGGYGEATVTQPTVPPEATAPTATEPPVTEGTTPAGSALTVTIANFSYSPDSVEVTANQGVTITVENQDEVRHNFAIFRSRDDAEAGATPIAATEIEDGPDTQQLSVPALAPGEYFVWCQVHTSSMTAALVAR